jgi:hypothetical protein
MSSADIMNLVRRRPFVPFRIVTSDGTIYEVRHPDLVMPGLASVVIGYPAPENPQFYGRFDIVSLRHVIRLEPQESPEPTAPAEGN